MATTHKTGKKAVRKTALRPAKRTSPAGGQKPAAAVTATLAADDLSHDVLHGPMKPLIYAAVTKRLHTIR